MFISNYLLFFDRQRSYLYYMQNTTTNTDNLSFGQIKYIYDNNILDMTLKNVLDTYIMPMVKYVGTQYLENRTQKEIQDGTPFAETLTIKELSDILQISMPTANKLVKEKGFPAFRIGKSIRINKYRLQEWMDKQTYEDNEEGMI